MSKIEDEMENEVNNETQIYRRIPVIHIHTDVQSLIYFSDKHGVCAYAPWYIAYAMQNEHVVGAFKTVQQIEEFYEENKFIEDLPIKFFWDEKRWEKDMQYKKLKDFPQ